MDHDVLQGFRLGEWDIHPELNRLVSKRGKHSVEGKVMAVLVELAKQPGQVISKSALLDAVWPNQTVAEGVLTRAVHELRRVLKDDAHQSHYIETVTRQGYRLLHSPGPLSTPLLKSNTRKRLLWPAVVVATVALAAISVWQLTNPVSDAGPIASVAVLPFANMTGDISKDYISDGLAEEVIHLIAQQPRLVVAARTSSFSFRDSGLTAEEIGQRLGVDSIVEGSVREERGVQRITVQLINTNSGLHEGSVTLDVVDGDLFDAQERMAHTIANLLADAGAPVDLDIKVRIPSTSAQTYDLYLKGRAALNTRSAESLQNAQVFFEEALRYDTQFAPAYAGLAQLYFVSPVYLQADTERSRILAENAAASAIRLDPNNADSVLVSAALATYRRDFEFSIKNFEQAIRLQPSSAQAHQWYGETLATLGYVSAARDSIETALILNPLAGSTNSVRAKVAAFFLDDPALLNAAMQADALGARLATRLLIIHHFRAGDTAAFARDLGRYHEVIGVDPGAASLISEAMAGNLTRQALLEALEPLGIPRDSFFARELALLGMPDEALAAMIRRNPSERAFTSDIWLPEFEDVRALPEFLDFVKTLGLDVYWLAHGLPDACTNGTPESFCVHFGPSIGA